MSHVSKYKMKISELSVLKSVLKKQGIKYKENCKVSLYGSNRVEAALAFQLPGWKYQCAVTKDGDIMFDHYGSSSSSFDRLGETVQAYNKQAIMNKAYGFATNWYESQVKEGIKITLEY